MAAVAGGSGGGGSDGSGGTGTAIEAGMILLPVRLLTIAIPLLLALAPLPLSLLTCASGEDTSSCNHVCSRYGDCFDEELDVDGCTSDCLDRTAERALFVSDLDRCQKCMDMERCREADFECFDECGRITGQSAL